MQLRWRAIGSLLVFALAFALVPAVAMAAQGISGTAVDSVTGYAIPFAQYTVDASGGVTEPNPDHNRASWNGKISIATTVGAFTVYADAYTHDDTDTINGGGSNYRPNGVLVATNTVTPLNLKMVRTNQPVYRFFNMKSGTHFYTASDQEFMTVYGTMSKTFSYDGVAYRLPVATTANPTSNTLPLYRFFNKKNGSHFYTADPSEKASVDKNVVYSYDGIAYYVSPTMMDVHGNDNSAVYRFYKPSKNSHFYTMNPSEIFDFAGLNAAYKLEGVGYYIDQYWNN